MTADDVPEVTHAEQEAADIALLFRLPQSGAVMRDQWPPPAAQPYERKTRP